MREASGQRTRKAHEAGLASLGQFFVFLCSCLLRGRPRGIFSFFLIIIFLLFIIILLVLLFYIRVVNGRSPDATPDVYAS